LSATARMANRSRTEVVRVVTGGRGGAVVTDPMVDPGSAQRTMR
jgi:hypothetical protein